MIVGGALCFTGGPASNITITNSVFDSAFTAGTGGGCSVATGGTATISACRFENCSAANGGGLDISAVAGVEINGSVFVGNSALNGDGGAIRGTTTGLFTISSSGLADNTASKSGGGAYVLANRSQLNVLDCTFDHNSALTMQGGGLFDGGGFGALTIYRCTFSGNTASGGGQGGGVCGLGNGGIGVTNSTFSGNNATGPMGMGGGVFNDAGPGSNFINSTFSGNMAGFRGGAIMTNKSMWITSCTLADNTAANGGAAIAHGPPAVTLKNTIVATGIAGASCFGGALASNGTNIDQDGSCGLAGVGDQSNVDPRLGPLQDNGGGTMTHALLAGSPAIDAAALLGCQATDQRGVLRPVDGNGDGIAVCDIGAFEVVDCNHDGLDDTSEINSGQAADCNHNGFPDACDITAGLSQDCDANGVPDECQPDSDSNGVIDACESPAPAPATCGACGLGAGMMIPLMLLSLGWMKRREHRHRGPGR